MSLQKELDLFQRLVGEYLVKKSETKKLEIDTLYDFLTDNLPPRSVERTAIDTLFNLVK